LQRACMAAIDSGDLHLSTLIAQCPGDSEQRDDIAEQLALWRKEGVDSHISRQHLRLYELLSGNVDCAEPARTAANRDQIEQVEPFDVAAGLDWKRAFGLHLWYGTSFESDLREAVDSYDYAVHELRTAPPPLPTYRAGLHMGELRMRDMVKTRSYDRDHIFELIKLSVDPEHDLETALSPCNFGPSLTDYRLPWHLYMMLSQALRVRSFQDQETVVRADAGLRDGILRYSARADALTANFADQLELEGQWWTAIFVLMHLQGKQSRKKAIQRVLERCVPDASESEIDYVVDELGVPDAWIQQARAHHLRYQDERYEEFRSLVLAQQIAEAHEVATKVLVPQAIVRTDHRLVHRVLAFLSARGGAELAEWNTGGRLYVDYIACVWYLHGLLERRQTEGLDEEDEERFLSMAGTIGKIQVGLPQLLPVHSILDLSKDSTLARIQSTQLMARGQ
ncbi:hypothetical protein OC846_006936, partial [Tilletia horrida]